MKELKGFEKVSLEPGETKTVSFELSKRSFAYYNTEIHDWYVESGSYEILIGKSSRDIVCASTISVESTTVLPQKYTINSTFGDVMANPEAKEAAETIMATFSLLDDSSTDDALGEGTADMMAAMFRDMPLRAMLSFGAGKVKEEDLTALLKKINH